MSGALIGDGKADAQRLDDERFEEALEHAYWNFESYRKRIGRPMAERDAFKAAVRRFIAERPVTVENSQLRELKREMAKP